MNGLSTATVVKRMVIALVMGAVVGFVGSMVHRGGAAMGFPWGLILAFALIIAAAWIARCDLGQIGIGFTLLTSSIVIWALALSSGGNESVLIPVGSPAFTTWASQYAGYLWLFGSIIVQLIVLVLPARWFPRRPDSHALAATPQTAAPEASVSDSGHAGHVDSTACAQEQASERK